MLPAQRPPSQSSDQEATEAKISKLNDVATSTESLPLKPTNVVRLEIYEVNGGPFEGSLRKKEIKDIWLKLGRNLEDVRQVRSLPIRGVCCKLKFTLHAHIPMTEISRFSDITMEIKNEQSLADVYKMRVVNPETLPSGLGQVVTVNLSAPDDVSPDDIKDWLQCFGELKSDVR